MIDATTGEVTAKKNIDAGYDDTVCVSCMNSHSSVITFDNWNVLQKPNCATLAAAGLTNQEFAYDASATNTAVYTNLELFTNSKLSACPVSACTLK